MWESMPRVGTIVDLYRQLSHAAIFRLSTLARRLDTQHANDTGHAVLPQNILSSLYAISYLLLLVSLWLLIHGISIDSVLYDSFDAILLASLRTSGRRPGIGDIRKASYGNDATSFGLISSCHAE